MQFVKVLCRNDFVRQEISVYNTLAYAGTDDAKKSKKFEVFCIKSLLFLNAFRASHRVIQPTVQKLAQMTCPSSPIRQYCPATHCPP